METLGRFILVVLPVIGSVGIIVLAQKVLSQRIDRLLQILVVVNFAGGFCLSLWGLWGLMDWPGPIKVITALLITGAGYLLYVIGLGIIHAGNASGPEHDPYGL